MQLQGNLEEINFMNKIQNLLKAKNILISDGAWGTFLHVKGLKTGECPELWNITNPNDVFNIAKSYIDAGADIIETNSFGGSRVKLDKYGLAEKTFELNKKAAQISRKAAGDDKIVLGSIGPSGKFLMMGDITEEDLYEVFKEQSTALEEGGANAIVLETFSDIEEMKIGLRAARENTRCEIACTMTFDKLATGEFKTMMGISPGDMLNGLAELKPDIVGANCGNGFENMISIVKLLKVANCDIPILVHANAGIPQLDENNNTEFPESPYDMAERFNELVKAGANIVGGCCGTTPEHIKMLVKSSKSFL